MSVNVNAINAGLAYRGITREEAAEYLKTTVNKFEKKLATGKLGLLDSQRLQELIQFKNPELIFYSDFYSSEGTNESGTSGCTLSFLPV